MRRIERARLRARLSDERAARLLQLLSVGAKLVNCVQERIVSPEIEKICKDSFGDDDIFEDCILDGGSAGKEFISIRELELGIVGLQKHLEQRPSAEARCILETKWRTRACAAAREVDGSHDVYSFGYGVTFKRQLFLADVPEMHAWATEKEKEFRRHGRGFYTVVFV